MTEEERKKESQKGRNKHIRRPVLRSSVAKRSRTPTAQAAARQDLATRDVEVGV